MRAFTTEPEVFAYALGEEVVVRLGGLRAFNTRLGRAMPDGCLPEWTIGEVARRSWNDGEHYLLRCVINDEDCLLMAPVGVIEGVA